MINKIPDATDFHRALDGILRTSAQNGLSDVTVKAGDLHRQVGGYPAKAGSSHRMPVCCQVMRSKMQAGDKILSAPPKGDGATLTIRYNLPR